MKKVLAGLAMLILLMICTISAFAEPSPSRAKLPAKANVVVQNGNQEQVGAALF